MGRSEILNDLAAVFRWTAKLNMHEGIANHFSVCVPDSNEDFSFSELDNAKDPGITHYVGDEIKFINNNSYFICSQEGSCF